MKTSPKRSYSVIENERFGLVFTKTRSIISGTGKKNIHALFIQSDLTKSLYVTNNDVIKPREGAWFMKTYSTADVRPG